MCASRVNAVGTRLNSTFGKKRCGIPAHPRDTSLSVNLEAYDTRGKNLGVTLS